MMILQSLLVIHIFIFHYTDLQFIDYFAVFIGNLTWAASESDVSEFVEFQDKIVSVKIQRYSDTNRSKGWW